MPLNAGLAFVAPSAMGKFRPKLLPPFRLNAPKNRTSSSLRPSVSPGPRSPWSFRASYHDTTIHPDDWSREILGRGWLLRVSSSLTRRGFDQVRPPSSEYRDITSR